MNKQAMSAEPLGIDEVKALRTCSNRYGASWTERKLELLNQFAARHIVDVNVLIAYHDCMLFLLAYPENRQLLHLAADELDRIAGIVQSIFDGTNQRKQKQLSGTGIACSTVHVAFSLDLTAWLADRFPSQVSIFEFAGEKETVREILLLLLPASERESMEKKEYLFNKLIQYAKGAKQETDLHWLVTLFQQNDLKPAFRDYLFHGLKLYITWQTDHDSPSRTYARSLPAKIYFQKSEFRKEHAASAIIRMPVPAAKPISIAEKDHLVTVSRGILAMLHRETDPSTYAETPEVSYFEMGKGIAIALYPMTANRRLPFDTYIGYMLFKNRLPVAYGGGWIFQRQCKIGINVLSAFRGGESAFLFLQLMRLYAQHYRVNRFVIEPYQIGYRNMEGLKSGAFWFYYRMGFVPVEDGLKGTAHAEYEKIRADRNYRTPLSVLKKLSGSNKELILDGKDNNSIDVLLVSEAITRMIHDRFAGNRQQAEQEALMFSRKFLHLKTADYSLPSMAESLKNFSMLLLMLSSSLHGWNEKDKKDFRQLITLKGKGSERKYVLQFQQHRKLNWSLEDHLAGFATG
ncbi:MAG: hypothetical protein K1X61_05315 [Chitinophagales bacterium]|nr:hypothetical protein [Chitinophagales bacterium]